MIVGTRESSNPRIHPFIKMILDLEKFVQNHAAAKMNINETNWAIRELKSPIRTNVVNMAFSSALKNPDVTKVNTFRNAAQARTIDAVYSNRLLHAK
jgi:hypothetical protein